MNDLCEIIVEGHLDQDWSGWFEGLAMTHDDDGHTLLSGRIRDQSALYGLLAKVRDLGLRLVLLKYTAGQGEDEKSVGFGSIHN